MKRVTIVWLGIALSLGQAVLASAQVPCKLSIASPAVANSCTVTGNFIFTTTGGGGGGTLGGWARRYISHPTHQVFRSMHDVPERDL